MSRSIFQDDRLKAVIFGTGQRRELSKHTAANPATLYLVKGKATVGLSGGKSPYAEIGDYLADDA